MIFEKSIIRRNLLIILIFFVFEIFQHELTSSIKFLNQISNNSNFVVKFEKQCKNKFCYGQSLFKTDNEIFYIKFNEKNARIAVKSLCNHFGMDNFYNVAFQCISKCNFEYLREFFLYILLFKT